MKPRLMRSGLTDTVWIVTRYRERRPGFFEAQTKYEVTDEELAAIGLDKLPPVEDDEPTEDRI